VAYLRRKRSSAPYIGLASRLMNWAVFKTWKNTIPPFPPSKKKNKILDPPLSSDICLGLEDGVTSSDAANLGGPANDIITILKEYSKIVEEMDY